MTIFIFSVRFVILKIVYTGKRVDHEYKPQYCKEGTRCYIQSCSCRTDVNMPMITGLYLLVVHIGVLSAIRIMCINNPLALEACTARCCLIP